MGLKDTVLGWLGRSADKDEALEDAELDAASREYTEDKADSRNELRLGTQPGEFDSDQSAPRR